jgi:quercetin dioxygenase-like cupin family protein
VKIIHESEVAEKNPPGRFLRWIADPADGMAARYCSCCIMRVEPGCTVSPAHCHPDCEELIYVIKGSGKVNVNGIIKSIREGNAVLFERGDVHMVRNSGCDEMKVACFFAPRTSLEQYELHPEVDFDGGVEC